MIKKAITTLNVLRILQKNMRLNTSEWQKIQEKKFIKLLTHAYQNVPFYRRLFDSVGISPGDIEDYEDISKIPITTKLQFQKAGEERIARNIDIHVEHKTSGSTGIRLSLFFSMEDALYNRGTYERARLENGLRILRDVLLYIGNPSIIPNENKWYEHFGVRRKEGLNVFEPLEVQIKKLEKVKPDALWGYPSSIRLLAKVMQEKEIKGICPRLIFTASELLDPKTRNFINSIFKVDLIDVYVAEEGGCMAWECEEHSGYHVNMDTVLMEFVDENGNRVNAGERGNVVITNLHSFAMPIIRYELGDYAIPTYQECSCGRPGYLIKAIEGRCDDFLKLSDNKSISPRILIPIIESVPGVSEFQLVQDKIDEFFVYIVKKKEGKDTLIIEEINKEFKKIFGNNISVDTKIVEIISREKSGKLRSMISRL
jgi:phenylacetate-CoA ligase